jgi:pilus assembly protein CpaC
MNTAWPLRHLAFIILLALSGTGVAVRADDTTTVRLMVGRSTVVNTDRAIARVSVTSAEVADAVVTEPNQVLVQGKVPGTISMFVWDRGGAMHRYDVTVERDLTRLSQQLRELFPGEPITAASNGRHIVVSGMASSKYVAEKAVEVAVGHVEKKDEVVNLVQVREGPPAQVLLRVRFAEVSRSALTELGSAFFTGPNGYENWVGRATTQQFPAPDFESDSTGNKLVFSDFLNLFLFNTKNDLGAVIKALQNRGLFQSLAEPNLVAETGKEASFLAGGEFPIPVVQAGSANVSISVVFKEFGVRLNFTPNVIGSRVRLKVRPEVSTLDFNNAVTLNGFRIPALSTRRTETELELQDKQTFAIAGLLNHSANESLQKIPGIGDIPILGYLFRSKAAQKNRTELVVMITPEILPPNSVGVTNELPRLREPFLPPDPQDKTFVPPAPAFRPPTNDAGAAAAPQAPSMSTPTPDAAVPSAEESAAVLRARMPKAPALIKPESATPAAKDDQKPVEKPRDKQQF